MVLTASVENDPKTMPIVQDGLPDHWVDLGLQAGQVNEGLAVRG